jgi:hypothetical protein
LFLKSGHSPAEVVEKGKSLFSLWVQKQATVSAFGDAFLISAIFLTAGILPTLWIRNTRFSNQGESIRPSK